jgi:hypothetical protein
LIDAKLGSVPIISGAGANLVLLSEDTFLQDWSGHILVHAAPASSISMPWLIAVLVIAGYLAARRSAFARLRVAFAHSKIQRRCRPPVDSEGLES